MGEKLDLFKTGRLKSERILCWEMGQLLAGSNHCLRLISANSDEVYLPGSAEGLVDTKLSRPCKEGIKVGNRLRGAAEVKIFVDRASSSIECLHPDVIAFPVFVILESLLPISPGVVEFCAFILGEKISNLGEPRVESRVIVCAGILYGLSYLIGSSRFLKHSLRSIHGRNSSKGGESLALDEPARRPK